MVNALPSYPFYRQLRESLAANFRPELLDLLDSEVGEKFKLLILIDLNGTLMLRTTAAGAAGAGSQHGHNFYVNNDTTGVKKKGQKLHKFFFRPGSRELLRRLHSHPRIKYCFYTNIMQKNIVGATQRMLEAECEEMRAFTIFDQEYAPLMRDHPQYDLVKEEAYDRYRDLDLVWKDPVCQSRFNRTNTLLVDSSNTKVQLWLQNAIISESYEFEDVQFVQREGQSQVRNTAY